ncbi:MAG TPA: mechanosensitive ion channel domain-containing protein [Stackebrandtia sp.]|uniref:mechanosensitive ion channel family protein n=1 Tax=Stackebrandtia sp. TaxID=2023065 RepID=UPI002D62B837|nr:mechanosensitive ion channel domain-containing protein [Stackebrandtia sp.]HZE38547.1 mechanosensitive ion channel domain-containing protein [Stackebrandtia sp.]
MLTSLLTQTPRCGAESTSACQLVWKYTHNAWLAESSQWLIVKPLRILMIIVICLVVRGLINRTIKRLARSTANGNTPKLLRPFRERVPNLMADADATELLGDRRKQRAATIGVVLRSLVTWLIYVIMGMLVLSELNVNLGPILASAGVVGVALGFGAQTLVKDVISGLFMIVEDQYGVGDTVDVGEVVGTVEVVGLRVTTVRDMSGTLWYVRNGEILRVGNHSQSWSKIVLDLPLSPSIDVDRASEVIGAAARELHDDPDWSESIMEEPDVQGVVDLTVDATVLRVVLKVDSAQQWAIGRQLRRRITRAMHAAGMMEDTSVGRIYVPRTPTQGGR